LEVFGVNHEDRVFHRAQARANSATWSPWEEIGGRMRAVAADTNSDGRIALISVDGAGRIFWKGQRTANRNDWRGWEVLPGTLMTTFVRKELAVNTNVVGWEQVVVSADIYLRAGESRQVIGQALAMLKNAEHSSMDITTAVQCVDSTGKQVGTSTWAETSLLPEQPDSLRPALLFRAPVDGLYTCRLLISSGSTKDAMTAYATWTYLSWSDFDEVGSHWWNNPECNSRGELPKCTYLGPGEPKNSTYIFYDDRTPLYRWKAADDAKGFKMIANVELTTCYEGTASCGGRGGGAKSSTVVSHMEAVRLDSQGRQCALYRSADRTDVIYNTPHHYNIPYASMGASIDSTAACGSSRTFLFRIFLKHVAGNPVKIDGTSYDQIGTLTQTNGYMINTYS
ncbi:tectonin domain-containing protein, partial [Kribbella ginsengisoli]|uniref:tectonin domain-containing protein n=1 Tax=Kribbella ginsengisoli TaxID=363865 RepID=UPI0031E25A61